ncbi:hypothetical protein H257_09012 [Aphanomyces astaci]|uniref:GTP cyclohydrolase 1 feedback regulatory protein n=1 Tax=Aphanomyces astaci TaxID=112090 RepID=W4GDV2_APHAT|nr:hypothetical protein H257_09012 [Aphanomyces astaci]ETV77118.1 hypothetical protein H257_09012 [Aphanomyces astaci]|eukprot:XP_009833424.1 hypothetical protein H257_09012 [Aphanomyces astaci]
MFILVTCELTTSTGPTVVGDATSDVVLMESLGASLVQGKCQSYRHYVTPWAPRLVLDELNRQGFEFKGMSGIGQTLVWTFCRP